MYEADEEKASKKKGATTKLFPQAKKKSTLELIQDDVRALRVKFVGKPKEEKISQAGETKETKKRKKKIKAKDLADVPEEVEEQKEDEEEDESTSGSPLYMRFMNRSPREMYESSKSWFTNLFKKKEENAAKAEETKKEVTDEIKKEAAKDEEKEKKPSLLGRMFGAIGGVFNIFRKKSASPTEVANAAAKAGATKGESVIAGILAETLSFLKKFKKDGAGSGDGKGDKEGKSLIESATDLVDDVKGLKDLSKSAKVFKNAKFLRNHPKLFKLAKAAKSSKLLAKLPGVGGNALVAPLLAGLAGAGAGFLGSKSSGASTGSGIFSALTGAGAGSLLAANIWNPVGWAMAAGMGANAMREGWNDKKTLKNSWGSDLTATDSQKGASAVGNIANYLSFGLLNKTGGRKYVDKALSIGPAGHYIGGVGGTIAGIGDIFRASKRADLGNSAEMTELELKRARAKLQTDIKRGDPEAKKKLDQFEKAVKEKDWHTARTISGVTVNAARDTADAWKRVGKGVLNVATQGMFGMLMGSDQSDPMTPEEIKKAQKRLAAYAKRNPTAGKKLLLDFEEAVGGERWAVARKISGMKNMNWLEKKFGSHALAKIIATQGIGLLFMNNENEPMSEKEIKAFQDKCMKIAHGGNKNAQQILDRFNEAVELGNWKVARKIAGKETESLFMKGLKANLRYSGIGMFVWHDNDPMSQKEIDDFHKKMQFRIEKGYQGAREQLDRFDNAVLTNNWKLARAISGAEAHSVAYKVGKAFASLYWGFADKPLTEAEIEKFRASMKRKIDLGDQTAIKILDRFDEAVGNQNWAKAREISKIENHSIFYKNWAMVGKAAKWVSLDLFMGDDNRPLSEADITKFHERMRKLIDQGNPEAKNMLAQFDDAVEDGNWKKARKIMGKKDLGHINNLARWIGNLGNDTVQELTDKDKDKSDAAKRYRFILGKVNEALTKKKLKEYWPELINLRNDMRKMDLLELDDDVLNKFQKRLTDIDRSAGVFGRADIEAYDSLHSEKMKFIERKQALLSEIKTAEDRCEWWERGKRSDLKQLFHEVETLSIEELDDETLDGFDEELRMIDSKALSTKTYDAETQKMITERLRKTNAILNDIERTRDGLGLFDRSARRRLNELEQDIESTLVEDRDDELFEDWNARLREVNPHALGSREYNPEEMKEIRERIRKRDLLVEAVKEAKADVNRFFHPKIFSRHNDLINEMEGYADDEIDDEVIADWEDRFKELNPKKAKSADELLEQNDALKALLRRRDTLVKAIKNAKRGAKRERDNKMVSKLEDLID